MIQLIQTATSDKNQQRKLAEKTIIDLRQQHPQQFFKQSAEVFALKTANQSIRQSAGTLIAVSVVTKGKTGEFIWDTISGNMKNQVKISVLEVLIDNDRNVRRTAANIVSAICFVELPRNEWTDIVQKICVNINHENQIVKQASILTLGFICSRMKQKSDFVFSPQTQDNILSGIIVGLSQSQHLIIETSLKALRDSMSSLTHTMANEQYRDFVIKQLANITANQTYRVDGLQILGEFVKTCYSYLGIYMDGLVQLLTPIVSSTANEEACVSAMEIWENVANQYGQLSAMHKNTVNYITGQHGQMIVGGLLQNLAAMEDSQDSDDNPISDSASKALQTIFQNGSVEYKNLVLEFVKYSISQNNWKHRQASIKAFSLLLYGLPEEQNQQLIGSSINQLMGLLNDSSKQVQFAALDSLTIITEVCGKLILMSPNFVDYLKLILSKISISQKFLKTGCKIVDNLCQSQKNSSLGKFTAISDNLIQFFLNFALANQTTLSVVSWSTATIMNILEVCNSDVVVKKYITFVLQNFDNLNNIHDAEKKQLLTSAFFTIMQFCLHGLKSSQVDEAITAEVYKKVVSNFKAKSDVNADGLYAVSVLVSFFNRNIGLVEDFWPYIIHALNKWQDPALFRATTNCIVSFMNCYGDSLGPRLDTFVPPLITLIQNPNFGKQLKLDCLVVLGEVFLICKQASLKYLSKTLQVILLCCSAVIQMTESDFSYAQELKDTIVQTLMCIANSETDTTQYVTPFIPNIFHFVMLTCDKKLRPTVSYMKRCVLLMADFAKTYPNAVNQLKRQQFVVDCINTLKTFNKNNEFDNIISYAESRLLR